MTEYTHNSQGGREYICFSYISSNHVITIMYHTLVVESMVGIITRQMLTASWAEPECT